MTPGRWQELKGILASAMALPEGEREAFVHGRTPGDPELSRQALSLLAAGASAEGFLSAPALEAAQSILESAAGKRHAPIAAGARFGPYQITTLIGAGGMGEVYRARDDRLERDVAIKILPALFTQNSDRLRRFEQEARAAGGLNHPNILAIFDIGSKEGAPYIVSELLEGETLRAVLASGALSSRKAIGYGVQIARGLAAAHEKGIVHRDLKPENLFVTKDGRVKILDFGLAKVTRPESHPGPLSVNPTEPPGTEPGAVMGTVGYMSPEQVRGLPADSRSDLFSLGAILYEMLSGERAFRGDTAAETMTAILKEDPPDLAVTGRNVTPGLDRIIRHCLEKNPGERFHSARDLAFDLESVSVASGEHSPRKASGRWLSRAGWLALAAAAATVVFWAGTSVHPKEAAVTFHRLTFRRGDVGDARFTPDGANIVYSASFGGEPMEMYFTRPDGHDSRPLGMPSTEILAISRTGELAVLKRSLLKSWSEGTLARIPFSATGPPRDVLEGVRSADWGPDQQLAVVRRVEGVSQLEYPIGKTVLRLSGGIWNVRVSPRGDSIAAHVRRAGHKAEIVVVDLHGKMETLLESFGVGHPVWSPDGGEVFYSADLSPGNSAIYGSTLRGRRRTVLANTQELEMLDISRDRQVLARDSLPRYALVVGDVERGRERDLSWLDGSTLAELSDDGSAVVFSEGIHGKGPKGDVFLRRTDGSPAVRLGDGYPATISPDGKWVAAFDGGTPRKLTLLPTGAGDSRAPKLPPAFEPEDVSFAPDSQRIAVYGKSAALGQRVLVMDSDGGNARPLGPKEASGVALFSPDGKRAAICGAKGEYKIWPVDGGPPADLALQPADRVVQWSADGLSLYLRTFQSMPPRIDLYDLATGRRRLWREIVPTDPAGVQQVLQISVSRDGRFYAYTYIGTVKSDLYLLDGLQQRLW